MQDGNALGQVILLQAETPINNQWRKRPTPRPSADEARSNLASYAPHLEAMQAAAVEEAEVRRRAAAAADAAEIALLCRIANDYLAGKVTQQDLADIYQSYRALARPGFADRWNSTVPFHTGDISMGQFSQPNADGCWSGSYPPVYGEALPPKGQAVVYTLVDAHGTDCYTGSTDHLRQRLGWHNGDGKLFVAWRAAPYGDREAAYEAEDQLLRQTTPYLNRKASR